MRSGVWSCWAVSCAAAEIWRSGLLGGSRGTPLTALGVSSPFCKLSMDPDGSRGDEPQPQSGRHGVQGPVTHGPARCHRKHGLSDTCPRRDRKTTARALGGLRKLGLLSTWVPTAHDCPELLTFSGRDGGDTSCAQGLTRPSRQTSWGGAALHWPPNPGSGLSPGKHATCPSPGRGTCISTPHGPGTGPRPRETLRS